MEPAAARSISIHDRHEAPTDVTRRTRYSRDSEFVPIADAPAGTDWLLNLLTVSGPAGEVARFRDVARGTGGVPWHLDLDPGGGAPVRTDGVGRP